jgi:hypothetical protein
MATNYSEKSYFKNIDRREVKSASNLVSVKKSYLESQLNLFQVETMQLIDRLENNAVGMRLIEEIILKSRDLIKKISIWVEENNF